MQKFLVILVALIGFGLSANAQCDGVTVKNVSASWGWQASFSKNVTLYNGNNRLISVQVEVTFVNSRDGSKKTVKGLFALCANSSLTPKGEVAKVESGWSFIDCDKSTIKITIIGG